MDNLGSAAVYVSSIALAELMYGIALHERSAGRKLTGAEEMLKRAQAYPKEDVNHHTAAEYAQMKANLAMHYLPDLTRRYRKKWVEDWVDRFTCKSLGIDDNDLWVCAQARMLNYTVVADDRMNRIKLADPRVKVLPIAP